MEIKKNRVSFSIVSKNWVYNLDLLSEIQFHEMYIKRFKL